MWILVKKTFHLIFSFNQFTSVPSENAEKQSKVKFCVLCFRWITYLRLPWKIPLHMTSVYPRPFHTSALCWKSIQSDWLEWKCVQAAYLFNNLLSCTILNVFSTVKLSALLVLHFIPFIFFRCFCFCTGKYCNLLEDM